METRNNQTVAFTGHRKERILQGFGNDPRILCLLYTSGSYPILDRKAAIGIAFISSIVIDVQF